MAQQPKDDSAGVVDSILDVLRTALPGHEAETTTGESALAALRIVYQAMESTVGGVVIADKKGHIIYVNRSFLRMFGYETRDEVLGRKTASLFAGQQIAGLCDVTAMIDSSSGTTVEVMVLRSDGSALPVQVACSEVVDAAGNVIGRMGSFVDISRRRQVEQQREQLIGELTGALATIKTLRGFLPICAHCKKIRDDDGYWHQLECYVTDHSDAKFSHGICPECLHEFYPEFADEQEDTQPTTRDTDRT